MKKLFFRQAVVATIVGCVTTGVAASDFYLGIGLGGGDLDVDTRRLFSDPNDSGGSITDSLLASELSAGLQFDSGLLAEIARDDYESFSIPFAFLLAGTVDYGATRINVGYAHEPEGRFGFVGKVGLSFWDVDVTESPFANPGDEEVASRSGQSLYLQLGGEFHITQRWRVGASFDFTDTNVGSAQAFKLNMRYVFKR